MEHLTIDSSLAGAFRHPGVIDTEDDNLDADLVWVRIVSAKEAAFLIASECYPRQDDIWDPTVSDNVGLVVS